MKLHKLLIKPYNIFDVLTFLIDKFQINQEYFQ